MLMQLIDVTDKDIENQYAILLYGKLENGKILTIKVYEYKPHFYYYNHDFSIADDLNQWLIKNEYFILK